MTSPLDALNALVDDLEDEGHSLAGRARDVASNIRDTYEHPVDTDELESFVQILVRALVAELNKLKDDAVKQVAADVRKAHNLQIHIAPGPGAGRAY
ncbi:MULTISPECIES: hypothetical protein [Streptomyces]|uniref:hypothetical protein n=1 Tax=Streptomyces TaxID=1883 RepID=UPI001B33E0FE|nr:MULTISPECIES: hypothetical protein [Streptomyces]MBP5896327.1 hypothetical protein [Streptomyces sp. LBUM 1481]MBP5926702.1 hypothetical protein [Streptomyces sp. LBUM 1483]MDX3298657.1 hypothetical protein [Streptomyces scabiei]MDX3672725.1 hypothetical protein [Streptomyces europaeiscabiei]